MKTYIGSIRNVRFYKKGTKFFEQKTFDIGCITSVKELQRKIGLTLAIDDEATIESLPKPYDDDYDTVLAWMEEVKADDPLLIEMLEENKQVDAQRREYELRQLEQLKKKYEG